LLVRLGPRYFSWPTLLQDDLKLLHSGRNAWVSQGGDIQLKQIPKCEDYAHTDTVS